MADLKLGDVVKFRIPSHQRKDFSGCKWAPAIVTRVWGSSCVNVKVIPDCGELFNAVSVGVGYGDPDLGHWVIK